MLDAGYWMLDAGKPHPRSLSDIGEGRYAFSQNWEKVGMRAGHLSHNINSLSGFMDSEILVWFWGGDSEITTHLSLWIRKSPSIFT